MLRRLWWWLQDWCATWRVARSPRVRNALRKRRGPSDYVEWK